MQKRFLLAVALSFIVLVVGQRFIAKPVQQQALPEAEQPLQVTPVPRQVHPQTPQELATLTEFTVDTELTQLLFTEQNAEVEAVKFKKYKDFNFPLKDSLYLGKGMIFNRQILDNKRVKFNSEDGRIRVNKELLVMGDAYEIKLTLVVENISSEQLRYSFPLTLGTINAPTAQQFQGITVSTPDKIEYPATNRDSHFSSVNFLSLRDSHFCAIIEPRNKNYSAQVKKRAGGETEVILQSPEFDISPGQKLVQEFLLFYGPQDLSILSRINPDWQAIVYFGKLDVIAHLLLKSLTFLHNISGNWGIAVILLSLIIYIILFPLTYQQLRSMREMQHIQPRVEELRCKYKDDPMRLQKATMELYKEHKINPLGGCLPMLLQIPVFISFYLVLARSIELKGANFLWIKDLSEPDKLMVFSNVNVPFLSNSAGNFEVNLLPILMTVASFFQQRTSSAQMSGQSAQQQKMMMVLFPLIFFFFFYHMPSGLVLYWFTNTVLTVFQQSFIMKHK